MSKRSDLISVRPSPVESSFAGSDLGTVAISAAQSCAAEQTRRTYAAVYTRFLRFADSSLGRSSTIADLDLDLILAYRNERERKGGRSAAGVSAATIRLELAALRLLLRHAGLDTDAQRIKITRGAKTAPQTMTAAAYERLLRMPDARSRVGRRDAAVLAILGEAGLRRSELVSLRRSDLGRARVDARHRQLTVTGKGGSQRLAPLTTIAERAIDAWLSSHPAAERPSPSDSLVTAVGDPERPSAPLAPAAIAKIVRRHGASAGIAPELCHPHALRHFWATRHAAAGTPIHRIAALAGHSDIRTTSVYLDAVSSELADDQERVSALKAS